jgi:hypothetical protein
MGKGETCSRNSQPPRTCSLSAAPVTSYPNLTHNQTTTTYIQVRSTFADLSIIFPLLGLSEATKDKTHIEHFITAIMSQVSKSKTEASKQELQQSSQHARETDVQEHHKSANASVKQSLPLPHPIFLP